MMLVQNRHAYDFEIDYLLWYGSARLFASVTCDDTGKYMSTRM